MTERSGDLAKVLSRFGADGPAVVVGRLADGELTSWAGVGLASLEHRAPACRRRTGPALGAGGPDRRARAAGRARPPARRGRGAARRRARRLDRRVPRAPARPAGGRLGDRRPGQPLRAWRPEILGADLTLLVDDARLQLSLGEHDWNATTYDRVMPDARARVDGLVGTYLSRELGAVAVVAAAPCRLVLTVGAAGEQPLHAVSDDLLRTPTHTVRPERDQAEAVTALLFSGSRMRAVRFDTAPGAVAAGFP